MKKITKKITIVFVAIALVALGVIFVIGQTKDADGKRGHKSGHENRGHKGMGKMLRHLDLSDQQKEQAKAIMMATFEANKPLRDQVKANRDALQEVTKNGQFDVAQIEQLAKIEGELHAKMVVERQRTKSQIFAILTPEQKAKAAEMKEQFKNKMNERKGKFAERFGQDFDMK